MEHNNPIATFLSNHRHSILEDWNKRIILDMRPVVEVLGVDECRERTAVVLDGLIAAIQQDLLDAPNAGIDKLSQKMAAERLTPSEIAQFIFSLKDVLFPILGDGFQDDDPLGAVAEVNRRIDAMSALAFEAYINTKETVIAEQQKAFQDVSAPVVKIWDRIIMIPLVGMLDSERTQLMMEVMLASLEDLQAKVAILDISGIPVVDTLVARHLITAATAVRLMGAECIITGIRARIAQTLVELGVDLGGFMTRTTLADGLSAALKLTDQSIG